MQYSNRQEVEKSPQNAKKSPETLVSKRQLDSFLHNREGQYKKESHNISGIPRAKNVLVTSFDLLTSNARRLSQLLSGPLSKWDIMKLPRSDFLFGGGGWGWEEKALVYTTELICAERLSPTFAKIRIIKYQPRWV